MILLTKLDNSQILVNIENIKYIEKIPDTLILFANGDSLIVRESLEEISRRVVQLKSNIIREATMASSK